MLVVGAAAALLSGKSAGPSVDLQEIHETPEGDFITEQDVCKIFDRLFVEMQGVLGQLGQQIQQLQMAGQQIPEAQLRQLLKGEFERALGVKQKVIFEDNDVDEDCLEEAVWEFLDSPDKYPKAKMAIERFQKLWENVSGESVVGKRPGKAVEEIDVGTIEILEPERLIEVAEIYFDALTGAMRSVVDKYKAEGRDMNSPGVAQQLQMEFSTVADEDGNEALKKLGLSKQQFQKSIEAHATKPQIGRALQMLQMKQQQQLMAMGIGGI